jgi:hypothetical protein
VSNFVAATTVRVTPEGGDVDCAETDMVNAMKPRSIPVILNNILPPGVAHVRISRRLSLRHPVRARLRAAHRPPTRKQAFYSIMLER